MWGSDRADAGDCPQGRSSSAPAAVPRVLRSTDRGDVAGDRLLDAALHVESVVRACGARARRCRGPGTGDRRRATALALEAADGTTVFIRADRLAEELARLYPDESADGTLDVRPAARSRRGLVGSPRLGVVANLGAGGWTATRSPIHRHRQGARMGGGLARRKGRVAGRSGCLVAAPKR